LEDAIGHTLFRRLEKQWQNGGCGHDEEKKITSLLSLLSIEKRLLYFI
jgi:hypothetical protein